MTTNIWIGFGFTALLVIFLIITFLKKDTSSHNQHNTLRFLTALCGGFAGGFISGDALFKLSTNKIALSGTAGFAVFFFVYWSYRKYKPNLSDGYNISIPENSNFENIVRGIAQHNGFTVDFKGFSSSQLALILTSGEIHTSSPLEALKKLKHQNSQLPKYKVTESSGTYKIKVS